MSLDQLPYAFFLSELNSLRLLECSFENVSALKLSDEILRRTVGKRHLESNELEIYLEKGF